ncbi:hypothetical protein CK203_017671 [Vitis vinifera]|uniref:Uncharacterized protein n=1 Tax=Vitis vinifera TaxID=29760 RepID=A0A438JGU3_VITVI|nr:hypothetical protein CK203_017671 [Vitis vinifera]
MEAPHLFGGMQRVAYRWKIIQSGFHFLHVGAYEGLQSLFSYSSDPVLPLLISSRECLEINSEIAPPVITQTIVSEDVHARMDRLEQHIRMSNSSIVWDDSDGIPVASLLAKFRMPRYREIAETVDRPLQRGDLVLKVIRGLIRDPRGKFRPSWSGPYFIRELILEGVAWLIDLDGNRFSEPTNVDQLKKYYV